MSFSHKPRPGFELRSARPADEPRATHGPPPPSRAGAALRLIVAALALAALPTPAGAAAPPGGAGREEHATIASLAAPEGGEDAQADGWMADSTSLAPSVHSGVARRRTAPRPASEIRSERRFASPGLRSAAAPRDLKDVNAWIEYKARAHVLALPAEARIFYRRGVLARAEGKREEGERWVRAAAELDPSFVEPHLTIAAWSLPGRPSQALVHWAAVLDLVRESFVLQAGLTANVLFLVLQSLALALVIAGMMIVTLRVPELSHPWRERLSAFLRPATARWWALAFVALPYLTGLGVVLPTIAFLGLLWPSLRVRERVVFVLLTLGVAGTPWAAAVFDRLATPLDAGRAPLYGVAMLESAPWSAERQQRLTSLAEREPENPFLHFGLAWVARRGGDLATAEREYRATLERWPGDDRVLTNLGNVLAMQGRADEALDHYRRASEARPRNPAPPFNESQIHTQRFEYAAATEALARASALDFDLVRDYQSLGTSDGVLALVDQWIAPRNFWLALGAGPAPAAASLPPSWRGRLETSGMRFTLIALGCALAGVVLGLLGHRALPLRSCNNCGRVVCRRCGQRRRETALCRDCAALETRAQNADFARVLMRRSRRQAEKLRQGIRTALAALLPGFGLLSYRRALTPLALIALTTLLIGPWAGGALPFELEPCVAMADRLPPLPWRVGLLAAIYLVSIGGYLSCAAKAGAAAAAQAARSEPIEPEPQRSPARAA